MTQHDARGSVIIHDDIPRNIPQIGDMTLADFPAELGLFPLDEALLLPQGRLPLNVFEPRYIALVEDALATNRLIGMIQPRPLEGMDTSTLSDADEPGMDDGYSTTPPLYGIGCIGRITAMTEREDGTYAITLTGIARFRLLRETGLRRGYRVARIDASSFVSDLTDSEDDIPFDREGLLNALHDFCEAQGVSTQWDALRQMDDAALLVTLPMICPFGTAPRQLMLEAPTPAARAQILRNLLDGTGHGPGEGASPF
ncbi:LON peptidase substrate-binding domain-containing protein [Komagataeibacter medellinensis]|uniref:Lon-like ATP-dependent protease La n=1 Tax=Komagataeibacter medellinensis (strain NBRC 3288 / BCRC 11682 / LMG 1693 / Kondo 51) TaxID=634177 RepID=G2I6Y7_KOMMN|nr:LON peptidase substrate-binding domain-containing protein [Komagataeibacter medellinensis]BAK83884.1 Lon-like ATP-dependent protease La [Komagataeibacter medellinensis NBRC 3288]